MSNQNIATYSPLSIKIILSIPSIGFTHTLGGFQEGTMITMARKVDTYTDYTGVDNTPSRVHNASTSMDVTCHLAQGSSSNDVLTALYSRDIATLGKTGLFQIQCVDSSGRSVLTATQAYIRKVPDSALTNNISPRDWIIHAVNTDYVLGGNSNFTQDEITALSKLGVTVDETKWGA
jgi:hypothetical protein